MTVSDWSEFREWGIAAVRLLQEVVYDDDLRLWGLILSSQSELEKYFSRVGLLLIVDETEGLAYLRQLAAEELPAGYDQLPKLFRRTRMGYDSTVLCVLLRDELRRFEEEEIHDERCVVETSSLSDLWKGFFPIHDDEVKLRKDLLSALTKLEDQGYVRRLTDQNESWEVRRILKARLTLQELENLKAQLVASASGTKAGREMGEIQDA